MQGTGFVGPGPLPLIFGLLGGLALFLFGMGQMAEALKFVAGDRMRSILDAGLAPEQLAELGRTIAVAMSQFAAASRQAVGGTFVGDGGGEDEVSDRVTEGAGGRMFEVTSDSAIVWEYMNPLFAGPRSSNDVYRAYRVPYGWIPQLAKPREQAVTPPALGDFSLP